MRAPQAWTNFASRACPRTAPRRVSPGTHPRPLLTAPAAAGGAARRCGGERRGSSRGREEPHWTGHAGRGSGLELARVGVMFLTKGGGEISPAALLARAHWAP